MSSTPSKSLTIMEQPVSEESAQVDLSTRRGSKIDTREIHNARHTASLLKLESKKHSSESQTLVDITLPVDVLVYTQNQIYLRFIGNPNVVVICDDKHPVVIPKGSKVQMDGNRLHLTEATVVKGCLVLMNGRKVRFKDAPCQALSNQEYLFRDNDSNRASNSLLNSNMSSSVSMISEISMQMVINDAEIQSELLAPAGKLISDPLEVKPLQKAA